MFTNEPNFTEMIECRFAHYIAVTWGTKLKDSSKRTPVLPALGEASTLSSQTWICDKYTGFQPTLAQFHIIKGCRLERYITLFRVKVSRITSVDCIILWLLIWLVNIGRPSVKPWCYWLWRLVISNWCVSIRLMSQLNSRLLLVKFFFVLSRQQQAICCNYLSIFPSAKQKQVVDFVVVE